MDLPRRCRRTRRPRVRARVCALASRRPCPCRRTPRRTVAQLLATERPAPPQPWSATAIRGRQAPARQHSRRRPHDLHRRQDRDRRFTARRGVNPVPHTAAVESPLDQVRRGATNRWADSRSSAISTQSTASGSSIRRAIHPRVPWCGDSKNRPSWRSARSSAGSARKCSERPDRSHRDRPGDVNPLKIAKRRRPTRNSGRSWRAPSSTPSKRSQISRTRPRTISSNSTASCPTRSVCPHRAQSLGMCPQTPGLGRQVSGSRRTCLAQGPKL